MARNRALASRRATELARLTQRVGEPIPRRKARRSPSGKRQTVAELREWEAKLRQRAADLRQDRAELLAILHDLRDRSAAEIVTGRTRDLAGIDSLMRRVPKPAGAREVLD